MNRRIASQSVLNMVLASMVALMGLSACGFKGPLVMPPASESATPPMEQKKIDGVMDVAPVDASGMGVKK